MKVIVTGSAGYIGGQTMLALKDAGHEVYGIDRREPPKHLRGVPNGFLYQDFASDVALSWIISKQPDAIIHCAGTSLGAVSEESFRILQQQCGQDPAIAGHCETKHATL